MSTGVLLTNLGTPNAPSTQAVKAYLTEFLSDPYVVKLPRWLLRGFIVPLRSPRTARLYQKIWQANGSPLLAYSQSQAKQLQNFIQPLALGMRYGTPSLSDALNTLRQANCEALIILPLYPQYSETTTGSTLAAIKTILAAWQWSPKLSCINSYYDHPAYINALGEHIRQFWQTHGKPEKLLLSFHGIPQKRADQGDPYPEHCRQSVNLLTEYLGLSPQEWQLCFQSRIGMAQWLQPYTNKTLQSLARQGLKNIHVACPGFSVDCLETLEEITLRNREIFLKSGGEQFEYIPALNDSEAHIQMMLNLINSRLSNQ